MANVASSRSRVAVVLTGLLAAAAALGSFGTGDPRAAPLQDPTATISIDDIGTGANEVWVWRSAGTPRRVVIFLHGRGDLTPVSYDAWFGYLALRDTAVIFPRYQESNAPAGAAETERALRAGITAGFANLRHGHYGRFGGIGVASYHGGPVLVAGFGYGATLAFYVATRTQVWGLGTPYAVDSIFPAAGSIAGFPAPSVPRMTRVLVQVDEPQVAVVASGRSLWRSLKAHSRKTLAVVTSTARLTDGLRAPLQTPAAEDAFWPPLDNYLEEAGGGTG